MFRVLEEFQKTGNKRRQVILDYSYAMSNRKKYLTIKREDKYFRLFHFEESNDRSIIVKQPWFAESKITYHANYGTLRPPFEVHQRGCGGRFICESVENRSKFISEYTEPFLKFSANSLPSTGWRDEVGVNDVVLDINGRDIADYDVVCFSYKRRDLLEDEFDNAVVAVLPLKICKLVVGCFERPKR